MFGVFRLKMLSVHLRNGAADAPVRLEGCFCNCCFRDVPVGDLPANLIA